MVLSLHMTKSDFEIRTKTLARAWVPSRDAGAASPVHPGSPKRERGHRLRVFWDYGEGGSMLHTYAPST